MIDEPAGALASAVRVCWAAASLALKIEATDGRLGALFEAEEAFDVDEPFAVVEVLAGREPGVPSSWAACCSTALPFANASDGERKEAYRSSAVSCCCNVRYSAWYGDVVVPLVAAMLLMVPMITSGAPGSL
jgi:hypothetical protein